MIPRASALGGLALVVAYTGLISGADGITKLLSGGYAAPQLYAVSGLAVAAFCMICAKAKGQGPLRMVSPIGMGLRAGSTVAAAICFFHAFRLLPFAEVFLFIGLMPILAGLMSGPILREHVRPSAWFALAAGAVGVACLFPQGVGEMSAGHLWAFAAAVAGTFSMIMARRLSGLGASALSQVFFPNLALGVVMLAALPFVWRPMGIVDFGWVLAYAVFLFAARWVLVVALRLLPAFAVTPLMNLQFVWMVVIGAVAFGEWPQAGTILGAAIVVASGAYLLWDQIAPRVPHKPVGDLRTDP